MTIEDVGTTKRGNLSAKRKLAIWEREAPYDIEFPGNRYKVTTKRTMNAEIGRGNNIQVTQEETNRALVEQARRYPGQERKVIEQFRSNPEMLAQIRGPLFEDKVIDFIAEMAKVTNRTVTTEELMAEPEDAVGSVKSEAESSKEAKPKKAKAKKED